LGTKEAGPDRKNGAARTPVPSEGMREFIIQLGKNGIKQEEIDLMAKKNPARLLGLEAF
jgi:hypothetical protein